MPLFNLAGTEQTKSGIAKTSPTSDPPVQITNDTFESFRFPNEKAPANGTGLRMKWHAGQIIKQSEFDAAFGTAQIDSVTGTIHAAGGDTLTVHGSGLLGVLPTGATLGGTACTAVTVVDDNTVTLTAPAKTAGTYTLSLVDDSGTITLAGVVVAA